MKTSNRESPNARQKPMETSHVGTADARWKGLYKVGAAAALIVVVLFLIESIRRDAQFCRSARRSQTR
jgi:hypothetical protein